MTESGTPAPPRSLVAAIFLLSLGLLLYELVLTRVLSVLFYYHTAFLAISLAVLGLGAGGLWVYLFPRVFGGRPGAWLAAASLSTILLPALFPVVQLDVKDLTRFTGGPFLLAFTLTLTASLIPFLLGGVVLATSFREHRGALGRLYAADLGGAAAGTLLLVPALERLGGPGALIACGAMIGLASTLLPDARRLGIALLIFMLALTGVQVREDLFPITVDVDSGDGSGRPADVEFKKWNAFSRVVTLRNQGWERGLSISRQEALDGRMPEQVEALIDINAYAPLLEFDGDLGDQNVAYLQDLVSNLAYRVLPTRSRVAIVGSGGGKDVLGALLYGSEKVLGIELNPILVEDLVRGRYREFTGGIYDHPDVEIVIGDGRSVLARRDDRFDLIVANSVATWASHSAGAMSLTENTLFTREAFELYFERLEPAGILSISIWDESGHAVPLRFLETAVAAGAGHDLAPIEDRSVVVGNRWSEDRWYTTVMVSKRPLDATSVEELASACRLLDFTPLWLPGAAESSAPLFARYFRDRARFVESFEHDIGASTDNRPFYTYTLQIRDALRFWDPETRSENIALFSLITSLLLVGAMTVAMMILPLWRFRRGSPSLSRRELSYFAAVGAGFMLVEVPLIHRLSLFLGHPTLAMMTVLGGLLAWTSLGSRRVDRWAEAKDASARLRRRLFGLVLLLAIVWWAVIVSTSFFDSSSLTVKIFVVLALLAPIGGLMGVALPAGLRLVGRRHAEGIPWAWAVNGSVGVLASILAIIIAIPVGFSAAFGLGVLGYFMAACTVPK